jgi:hypothetical protein
MMDDKYIAFNLLVQPPDDDDEVAPAVVNGNNSSASNHKTQPHHNVQNKTYTNTYLNSSKPHRASQVSAPTSSATDMDTTHHYNSIVIDPPPPQPLQKDRIQDTFSEMQTDFPKDRNRPLIVLDCANIGWTYGIESFSAAGVLIAINYFRSMDADVKAFLPASYIRSKPGKVNAVMITEDIERLSQLVGTQYLTIVPAGDYDDAYILNYARENCGFIVSNDLFQDHINKESNDSIRLSMRLWISENRCGYTFVGDNFLLNPCSNLNLSLKKMLFTELSMGQKISLPATLGNLEHQLAAQATQLGKTCQQLLKLNRAREMKHVILARAYLLIEVCFLIVHRSFLIYRFII